MDLNALRDITAALCRNCELLNTIRAWYSDGAKPEKFDEFVFCNFRTAEQVLILLGYEFNAQFGQYLPASPIPEHNRTDRAEGATEGFVGLEIGRVWQTAGLISQQSTQYRDFTSKLFMPRGRYGPRLAEIGDKVQFILFDVSKQRIVGAVSGFDLEAVCNAEKVVFGNVPSGWKTYL